MSQSDKSSALIAAKSHYDEFDIYVKIKDMVKKEVDRIYSNVESRNYDIARLEKLAKIYAILKDDLREDAKSDLWKKLGVT